MYNQRIYNIATFPIAKNACYHNFDSTQILLQWEDIKDIELDIKDISMDDYKKIACTWIMNIIKLRVALFISRFHESHE